MRILNLASARYRFWTKVASGVFVIGICTSVLFLGVNRALGVQLIPPLFPLLASLLGLVMIIILFSVSSYRDKNLPAEYLQMETVFQKAFWDTIGELVDERSLSTLYSEEPSQICAESISILQRALVNNSVLSNPSYKYLILLKVADCHIKNGDYGQAIVDLNSALSIAPYDTFANIRMATVHELLGDGPAAISSYVTAMRGLSAASEQLSTHIAAQIDRIKRYGPRKPPMITGLRYMSH